MMFETEDRTDGRGKYLRLPMVENMFLNSCYIEQKIEHEKLKEGAELSGTGLGVCVFGL